MNSIDTEINNLSLKEKIAQMFILGFSGTGLNSENNNIQNLAKNGLGGVILFAENIKSYNQVQNLSKELQNRAKIPLFVSIDQEGGLVERTINIKNKIDFLTPMALAAANNPEPVKIHTQIMAEELKFMGINMNFAPVVDVNTNINNPVIGIRSFGSTAEDVIKYSEPVYKTFMQNNIIPVAKHFPGHGDTSVDSHLEMPVVDLSMEMLENIHIKPFKDAIDKGISALMVSHVFYKAFNNSSSPLPASLSREIITDYLKGQLNYKGLIISDDMVMGGISKHYNYFDACITGINAGIDLFIFKDSGNEICELVDKITDAVEKNIISVDRINESVEKILFIKKKYGILNTFESEKEDTEEKFELQIIEKQKIIDEIALKSIKIEKNGNLIPLDKNKKYLVLSPDKSKIFNLSKDTSIISDFLGEIIKHEEKIYSLNPKKEEIADILNLQASFEAVIFIEYNSVFFNGQIELLKKIKTPVILISTGVPYVLDELIKIDSLIRCYCFKTPSLKAVAKIIQ